MRVCKLAKTDELTLKHGRYAEVLGLIDSPSGVQARLKFGDGHRTTLAVRRISMIEKEGVKHSKDGWL